MFVKVLKSGLIIVLWLTLGGVRSSAALELPEVIPVPGQPVAANVSRLVQALELLGTPLPSQTVMALKPALDAQDAAHIQTLLDPHALFVVQINPESRVKVQRGPARATIQQGGFVPVIVKVVNQSAVTKELRITSPQAGQVYAGMTPLNAQRMQRQARKETEAKEADPKRFLEVSVYSNPPMTPQLSGLEVEYAVALIYSRDAGKLEATIGFEVGQGNQDLGFRGETAVLFDVRAAVPVQVRIKDHDGRPATARLVFRDEAGHVFPPQPKRLAPDFYFQEQIYRHDGDNLLLPPGQLTME